jgi:hypothetical protein
MKGWYIWDRKTDKVYPADVLTARKSFDEDDRRLARDVLPGGGIVSTVFLGLDHSYREGPPVLWETMVFPSEDDFSELYMERYTSREDALEGHARAVAMFKEQQESER